MRYLVVDDEGRVLAALQSLEQAARELARLRRGSEAERRLRVVRYDEYGDGLMTASSFITASPLPPLRELLPRRR
jgi:hypothetical protein